MGRNRRFLGLLLAFALLPLVASAAQPASAPAAKQWSGKDAQGREITVPAADKATIMLFIRPGQGQSDDALKIVTGLVKDRKDVQVIAVISGDAARNKPPAAATSVVLDEPFAVSGQFGVKVWPTVSILNKTGIEAAHIAGLPVTFANEVGSYLDFAVGKIDRAALDKALANREVVADSESQKAARHAEVALRLATKGMKDAAKAEVAKAIELKPRDPVVLARLARVNLLVNEAAAAKLLIDQLKEGQGVTAGELNILRGWAAVVNGQWAEAKELLQKATMLNPEPAEAYYLLGRTYQQEGDLPKAAEAYRKAFERSLGGREMGIVE